MKWGALAIIAGSLVIFGCKKDKETETDLSSAEDQTQAEMVYDQVFKQVDESANTMGLKKGGYPIIMIDTTASPRTMRIYYGDTNYLCLDGNYRRGSILVSWTGRYRDQGTLISIGFENFYQNDNKVSGTKTILNNGRNSSGYLNYTITVNGQIIRSDGGVHTWTSNRTRTWVAGESTLSPNDDIYEISGSASGKNRNGVSYTSTITTNLRVDLSCQWRIVSGVIEITPEGKSLRKVDFGSGACDRLVTVTVNGKTRTFERRK